MFYKVVANGAGGVRRTTAVRSRATVPSSSYPYDLRARKVGMNSRHLCLCLYGHQYFVGVPPSGDSEPRLLALSVF